MIFFGGGGEFSAKFFLSLVMIVRVCSKLASMVFSLDFETRVQWELCTQVRSVAQFPGRSSLSEPGHVGQCTQSELLVCHFEILLKANAIYILNDCPQSCTLVNGILTVLMAPCN